MQTETPARVSLAYPRHQNRVIICKNAIDTGRKCEFIMAHIPYQLALAPRSKTHACTSKLIVPLALRRARLYYIHTHYTLLFHWYQRRNKLESANVCARIDAINLHSAGGGAFSISPQSMCISLNSHIESWMLVRERDFRLSLIIFNYMCPRKRLLRFFSVLSGRE